MLSDEQIEQLWDADQESNRCDVCHDMRPFARAIEQAVLTQPIVDVDVAKWIATLHGWHFDEAADLLQRTEAARRELQAAVDRLKQELSK